MLTKQLFVGFSAAVWLVYGLICAIYPELLQDIAALNQQHWSGAVEVRAMYGGAQISIGLFALVGLLRPREHLQSTLLFLFILYSGLVLFRVIGLFADGPGILIEEFGKTPEAYNAGALWFFELPMLIWGFFARSVKTDPYYLGNINTTSKIVI